MTDIDLFEEELHEIKKRLDQLEFNVSCIINMFPKKYRKHNPKPGEDPFFAHSSFSEFNLGESGTEKQMQKAKTRMLNRAWKLEQKAIETEKNRKKYGIPKRKKPGNVNHFSPYPNG